MRQNERYFSFITVDIILPMPIDHIIIIIIKQRTNRNDYYTITAQRMRLYQYRPIEQTTVQGGCIVTPTHPYNSYVWHTDCRAANTNRMTGLMSATQ